jgi:hypothetical protein
LDLVTMPPLSLFSDPTAYYSTLFHELTHSTGHADRLNRSGITDPIQFGSHRYSAEELVAEFGAAMLCGAAGRERACYVEVAKAPGSIFRAFQRGRYPVLTTPLELETFGAGRMVRLGAYGDPYAVPFEVWAALLKRARGNTGYTHQWRRPDAAPLAAVKSIVIPAHGPGARYAGNGDHAAA